MLFPHDELMTTFGVIYPQLWATNPTKAKEMFHIHLSVLKALFCVPWKVGESGKYVFTLLSS
jgi:hypothetical protein